jgi:hypothetical protein
MSTTTRDPYEALRTWLAVGPTELPPSIEASIAEATRSMPQSGRGTRRLRRASRPNPSRAQLLGLAATIGLAAVLGAVTIGVQSPDRTEVQPRPTVAPTSEPRQTTQPLDEVAPQLTRVFESPRYEYTIRYPEDWRATAATTVWTPNRNSDFPADFPATAVDTLTFSPFRTIAIASAPDHGLALSEWVDANVKSRQAGVCNPTVDVDAHAWTARTVGGYGALARESCGYRDVVIALSDRVLVLSMPGGAPGFDEAGRALLDAFLRSLSLPAKQAATIYTSPAYGYRIQPPTGSTVEPATGPWAAGQAWDMGPAADRFSTAKQRFTVAAIEVEAGTTAADFIEQHRLDRPGEFNLEHTPPYCKHGGTMIPGLTAQVLAWRDSTVAGRAARVRAACGHVDAVVIADGRAWLLSSFTELTIYANEAAFAAVADTIVFQSAIAAGRTTYLSPVYGYRIAPEEDAVARLATERWDGRGAWDGGVAIDRYTTSSQVFTVTAMTVDSGTTAADFVAAHGLGRRGFGAIGSDRRWTCYRGSMLVGPIEARRRLWTAHTIVGHPGVVRAACGYVDAVVVVHGKAWVMSSTTAAARGADVTAFDAVAETIEFPSVTLKSEVYGYRITPQGGAVTRLATEPWDGVDAWDMPPTADRFSGDGHLFTVVAVDVKPGTTARTFVDAHGLDRPREFNVGMRHCKRGAMMIPGLTADRLKWNADVVAGLDAQIRAACGHVDAVVIAEGKAWVLHSVAQARLGADIEAFHRVADTIVFFPDVEADPTRTTYTSAVHGYRITPRYDSVARLATETWDGRGPWDRAPSDRFLSPGQRFTVVSLEVAAGTTARDVARTLLARRRPVTYRCGPPGAPPPVWVEHRVGGHDGLIRVDCGYVDAVAVVDGRGWLFSSYTSMKTGGNVEAFDAVADTIEFP